MSFSAQQARSLLSPLRGKVAVFSVPDRISNLALGQLLLSSLEISGKTCTILDIDAFYSSNSDLFARDISHGQTEDVWLYVPEVGASAEDLVLHLLNERRSDSVIVDNLNSFFNLFSFDDRNSASRKFTFLMDLLSYLAHSNDVSVLVTLYEREKPIRRRRARSFSGLGDLSLTVGHTKGRLTLQCDGCEGWPDGALSLPSLL
jgi:hypothetical protein